MHAWYFTFEFPPDFGGGLSTYMQEIVNAYRMRGSGSLVVFAISTRQSGLMMRRAICNNVQLVTINPEFAAERQTLGHWVTVSRLFERFAEFLALQIESGVLDLPKPDYLEFADGFGIGALTIQQKLCRNSVFADTPIIVTAHTPTYIIDRLNQIPNFRLPHYWTSQMELQALAGADLVVGCSQAILNLMHDEFARTGGRMARNTVIHNPLALPAPAHEEAHTRREHFYMASRLTHWKGVESAIKAFEILWSDGHTVPFHIYGEDTFFTVSGTHYSEYIEKHYRRHIDAGLLHIMGKQPRHIIDEQARHAVAQVHPSHFDNFPYTVLEAMASGTICVAGHDGGIREIAEDGRDILLADVMDAASLADRLRAALRLSDAERRAMRKSARSKVAQHCDPMRFLARKDAAVRDLAPMPETERRAFPFLSPPDVACVQAVDLDDANAPELSVVIPYFNMGAFIDETLDSLRNSTVERLEILLINDGSTDAASVNRLGKLNARHGLTADELRIVSIPNAGVANARNTGAQMARAPFLTLLDADDHVDPTYYDKALSVLRHYDNVSFCGAWVEDYNTSGRLRNWATWNAEPPIQLMMNQTNCQSLVYKRSAFLRDGLHDPDFRMFLDDWEGMIALLAAGHRGVMIPEPLFHYRIRGGSVFRSRQSLWDLNYEKITRKHPELFNTWGADIAAFLNANGPNRFYHVAGQESGLDR